MKLSALEGTPNNGYSENEMNDTQKAWVYFDKFWPKQIHGMKKPLLNLKCNGFLLPWVGLLALKLAHLYLHSPHPQQAPQFFLQLL